MHNFTYPEVLALARTIEEENPKELIVPERLTKPHDLIVRYQDSIKSEKDFQTDITYLNAEGKNLKIEVTQGTLNRALKFFNSFISLAEARGHQIQDKEIKLPSS